MRVLFNKKFHHHNVLSDIEGSYRIVGFEKFYDDEDCEGENYIDLVHKSKYHTFIKNACMNSDTVAEVMLTPESYYAATTAVGLSILASEQGDFALVRPPGHHAGIDSSSGFCFFNNIAIATQRLVEKGKRVLIIDIDGHHGNGTQDFFYQSGNVMYASVHQAFTFPFTGNADETGESEGKGTTLNIPLIAGTGNKAFLKALDKIIMAGFKFEPDVVAVSAGFDAYYKDRLLSLKYTEKAFYESAFRIRRAFSNVFAVLEGGYHHELKKCIDAFVSGINVGSRPAKDRFDHEMSIG